MSLSGSYVARGLRACINEALIGPCSAVAEPFGLESTQDALEVIPVLGGQRVVA